MYLYNFQGMPFLFFNAIFIMSLKKTFLMVEGRIITFILSKLLN